MKQSLLHVWYALAWGTIIATRSITLRGERTACRSGGPEHGEERSADHDRPADGLGYFPEPGQARAVQIDRDPRRIGLRYPVEVGLAGDAKATLRALLPLLRRREDRSFLEFAQFRMKEWQELIHDRATRTDVPLKPQVFSTIKAIAAERIAPRLVDRYLPKTGYDSQQTNEPVEPDRMNNLWAPVPGDHGAHGTFDARARESSVELWLSTHRGLIAGGLLAAGAIASMSLASRRRHATRWWW